MARSQGSFSTLDVLGSTYLHIEGGDIEVTPDLISFLVDSVDYKQAFDVIGLVKSVTKALLNVIANDPSNAGELARALCQVDTLESRLKLIPRKKVRSVVRSKTATSSW